MHRYRTIAPSPRLARYVECYWSHEEFDGTRAHCVLPDGCADILFSSLNGEPAELSVVGLMTSSEIFEVPAGRLFFGIRFRPGMAAAFIPETAQLIDQIEAVQNLVGAEGRELFERLADCTRPEEMGRVAESFLRPLEPPDAGRKAIALLGSSESSIDRLASESGISTRQLRRICLERAGVSPKFLSRILRFRRAAQQIRAASRQSAQPRWAQIAAGCGYFDQAHFIHDFQQFAGCTPGRYLQSLARRSS
jgi:AraC-like DNA-binding protein